MDVPPPTNAQIEAAKAIGAIIAKRQGSAHAFIGVFALSLLQASTSPQFDLTQPLEEDGQSACMPSVHLSVLIDYYTNMLPDCGTSVMGDGDSTYNAEEDYSSTTQLFHNDPDARITVSDDYSDDTPLWFHYSPPAPTTDQLQDYDSPMQHVRILHTTVDYENTLSYPRFPSHLCLQDGQSILHIPVTGGATIPILHPSLLAPHLIYNARATTYYNKPSALLDGTVIGIPYLLEWLAANDQKMALERYVAPRQLGWRPSIPLLDEWDRHTIRHKYMLLMGEVARLRRKWVNKTHRIDTEMAWQINRVREGPAGLQMQAHVRGWMEQQVLAIQTAHEEQRRRIFWMVQLLDKATPS